MSSVNPIAETIPGRSSCMEAEYATRKQQLLEECQVAPQIFDQVMPRLATFMVPFVDTFCRQEPSQHAQTYYPGHQRM